MREVDWVGLLRHETGQRPNLWEAERLEPDSDALPSGQGGFDNSLEFEHRKVVKPKRIRLFIKPYCGWCHKAMHWLDERGIGYERIDVLADEAAYHEMMQVSKQELAPVIDVDGEILADFGPDQLADFWQKLESKYARTNPR